jgi:hypothetical protein
LNEAADAAEIPGTIEPMPDRMQLWKASDAFEVE